MFAPAAKETGEKLYACFGAGDIPGIIALVISSLSYAEMSAPPALLLHASLIDSPSLCDVAQYAPDAKVVWNGDSGRQEFVGFPAFVDAVLARIPEEWPTLKVAPKEWLIDAGPKCFVRMSATTEDGMDTEFGHYLEVNAEGKVVEWHGFDDAASFMKYSHKKKDGA